MMFYFPVISKPLHDDHQLIFDYIDLCNKHARPENASDPQLTEDMLGVCYKLSRMYVYSDCFVMNNIMKDADAVSLAKYASFLGTPVLSYDFPPQPVTSKAEAQDELPNKKRKQREVISTPTEVPASDPIQPPVPEIDQMEIEEMLAAHDELTIDLTGSDTNGFSVAPVGYNGVQSFPTPTAEVTGPLVIPPDSAPTLPILLRATENFDKTLLELSSNFPNAFNSKSAGEYIKISPSDETTKFSMMAYLKEKNQEFYLESCPPFKVVIKGLPAETDVSRLKDELSSLGFPPLRAVPLSRRGTNKPRPMFLVELPHQKGSNKILSLTTLLLLDVKVEPFRNRNRVVQCYQCNWFGHTSALCFMKARCLKCEGCHATRDCALPRAATPFCINCRQTGHVACSRRCPAFPKPPAKRSQVKKRPSRSSTKRPPAKPHRTSQSTFQPTPSRSLTTSLIPRPNLLKTLATSRQFQDAAPMLELFKELAPIFSGDGGIERLILRLREQKDPLAKLQVFFDFFCQ